MVLLVGDLFFFIVSLWLTLLVRYRELPSEELFYTHLGPFSLLFVVWILVFYIAGLYEKHTVILKSRLPSALAQTQLVNSAIAVAFFYLVPFFLITPKTILFIYLFISLGIVLAWRMYGYFIIGRGPVSNAILIGAGSEMKELLNEVNNNPIYSLRFISSVDLNRADETAFWKEIVTKIYTEDVSVLAIDLANENVEPVLPHLYNLIFAKVSFIDMHKIYEDIFYKVPISLLRYNWFLENISTSPRAVYDALKRIMDVALSLILFILSLPVYLAVYILVKLDDGGPLFIVQERVGEGNKLIRIVKFRSMTRNDQGEYGKEGVSELQITKVGRLLRKSRVDELPQLWNVIKGDLSLIGPRPELPALARRYSEEIPYYNVRHLVRPGLSGWAQIYHETHPHHEVATEETRNKLSYDLYYIKNRSFLLDIKIALRTLKTLVSIAGR